MAELHIAPRLVETDAATVFAYLGDMNNYEEMMPESVYEWQSTQDSCNFKIKGLSAIGMKITVRNPHETIQIVSDGDKPFPFSMRITVKSVSENQSEIKMDWEGEVNAFMWMMAEKPLGQFFGYLSKRVAEKYATS